MTTPTALAELIAACAVGAVDDRPSFAAFDARMSDENLATWLGLRASRPAFLDRVLIRYPQTDEDIEDDARPTAQALLKITLNIATAAGELRLFFARSLDKALDEIGGVAAVRIADMAPDETFATFRARFGRWSEDPPPPFSPSDPLPDPRALARDLTGASVVPSDIRPWLLRAAPQAEGQAFAI